MADVRTGYTVQTRGFDELIKNLEGADKTIDKHLRIAMQRSVIKVQKSIIPLVPVGVSGNLQDSIGSEIRGVGSNIQGKVGSNLRGELYPSVMEFGRRKNRTPPPWKPIARWLHLKKGVPADKHLKGVAIGFAKKIGKRGIKGKRFMKKGWERSREFVRGEFHKAADNIIKDIDID